MSDPQVCHSLHEYSSDTFMHRNAVATTWGRPDLVSSA